MKLRKRLTGLDAACLRQLQQYSWPGNVRELKNVLERAAILTDEQVLTADALPDDLQLLGTEPGTPGTGRSLRELEKRLIQLVLQETGGNKTEAARQLGIGLKTLYRKITEYGI